MKKIHIKNIALALALGFGMASVCGHAEAGIKDFFKKAKEKIKNSKAVKKVVATAKEEVGKSINKEAAEANIKKQGSAFEWGNKLKSFVTQYSNKLNQLKNEVNKLKSNGTQNPAGGTNNSTASTPSNDMIYIQDFSSDLSSAEKLITDLTNSSDKYLKGLKSEVTVADRADVAVSLGIEDCATTLVGKTSDLILYKKKITSVTTELTELDGLGDKINIAAKVVSGTNTSFTKEDLDSL